MADLLSMDPIELLNLVNSVPLNSADQSTILGYVDGLVAAGVLPKSAFPDPITWNEVTAYLNDPAVDLTDKIKITHSIAIANSAGLLTSFSSIPDSHPPNNPGGIEGVVDWVRRAARGYFEEVYASEMNEAKMTAGAALSNAETRAIVTKAATSALEKVLDEIGVILTSATGPIAKLSAQVINRISGTNINPNTIENDLTGVITRAKMVDIGNQFGEVVRNMFPIASSKAGEKARSDRQFAVDNINAYFGTNLNYQMRTLSIGTLASTMPFLQLRQFENLHQSLLWAYGLPWMSWSVLSAIMNVTTTKPLVEYYNSQILGNDYSEAEALNAYVQKRIDATTLKQVLDNQGMRPDIRDVRIAQTRVGLTAEKAVKGFVEGIIDRARLDTELNDHKVKDEVRDTLIEEARPQLTESDVQQMYDHGLAGESDVSDHYKRKGFADYNLQAKIDLVKDDRTFRLQQQLTNDYFKAFTLGKVTQDEYTQYLNSQGYTQIQVDIELHRAQLDMRAPKVKHLTVAEVLAQVTRGAWTATQGLQRLLDMGWDRQDATDLLSFAVVNHALDLIPRKIKDACLGPDVEANLLSAAISTATQLDPTYPIRARDFMEQAACVLRNLTSSSGGGTTTPPVQRPPAPLSLVGAPGSRSVSLAWQPIPMLADYQVYRRQIGSGTFTPVNAPSVATTFVDSNLTPGEIYIYVVRSQVNGVESDNSNEVQVQAIA